MSVSRHRFSFFVALLFYSVALFAFSAISDKFAKVKSTESKDEVIRFELIEIAKEVEETKKRLESQKVAEVKKEKIEKAIEKIEEPKTKIEKEIAQKESEPKEIIQKEPKKAYNAKNSEINNLRDSKDSEKSEIKSFEIKKSQIKKENTKRETKDDSKIDEEKRRYYAEVKKSIEENKKYPKVALRRGIEGEVKVRFIISKIGELISCEVLDGPKIFHSSTKESIKEAFPLKPTKNLFTKDIELTLVLNYSIY